MSFDADLLRKSFQDLVPKGNEMVDRFYKTLIERNPELKPLFAHSDMNVQRKMLLQALVTTVNFIDQPAKLEPYLRELGQRHVGYGAQPAHYAKFIDAMLEAMARTAGESWNEKTERTWRQALDSITRQMKAAAQ